MSDRGELHAVATEAPTPAPDDGAVFHGVGVATITVFHDDGSIDPSATAEHCRHLVDAGIRAVVVAGSTGEAATLSPAERATLVATVRQALPHHVAVIAGTGAQPSAHQAVGLTEQAIDAGADAVLVLSPPAVIDCRPYYEAVARVADDMPVLAYHYPAVSGPGIPVDVVRELPIAGMKDSAGDAERLLIEADELAVGLYVGHPALLSLAGTIGCSGAIMALANVDPQGCIRAFSGDGRVQRELINGHRQGALSGIGGLKRAVHALTGVNPTTRVG